MTAAARRELRLLVAVYVKSALNALREKAIQMVSSCPPYVFRRDSIPPRMPLTSWRSQFELLSLTSGGGIIITAVTLSIISSFVEFSYSFEASF
jgi:hypothetical protein